MKRNRNAKITATVGPVVSNPKNLERLYLDGVDIFRMNFSHGSHEEHAKTYEAIRAIGKRLGVFPTIFADLQGPKFRIGTFEDDKIILQKDDAFRFDLDSTAGDSKRAYLPHPEIFQSAEIGTLLLLDDGKLKFEVISRGKDYVETRVLVGGELSNRKGVAVPNLKLHSSKLTKKDEEDLKFALNLGVDWIVLSMVQ
ncbi:MAG: pyruvate kinase, partial [Holosporaceae bacterium]|nr:pyruvate kinase [Holosporaceae bacterium]